MKRRNSSQKSSQEGGGPSPKSPKAGPRRKKNHIMDTMTSQGGPSREPDDDEGAKNKGGKGRKRERNHDKVQVKLITNYCYITQFQISINICTH